MRIRLLVLSTAVLMGTAHTIGSADFPHVRAYEYVEVYPTETCRILVTAYNSEESQTDDTPHLTSSQTPTRWGVVAARWLPVGTRVFIPGRFGDEAFIVEDRMAVKNWCKMDVWHAQDGNLFGIQFLEIIIVGSPEGFSCPMQPPAVEFKCPEPVTEWERKAAEPRCPSYIEGCPQDEAVRVALSQ